MGDNHKLKRPTIIYILAIGFIVGPIFSFFYSLYLFKERPEFSLSLIPLAISAMDKLDLIWMILCFLAGCLLLIRRKLTWAFALIIFASILCVNIYNAFTAPEANISPLSFWPQVVFNLVITAIGMIVVFYFRFPYLDRRMPWIKNYVRYDVQQEAQIIEPFKMDVVIENISRSGFRVKIKENANSAINDTAKQFTPNQIVEINLKPLVNENIQAIIVLQNGNICRMKFGNLSSAQAHSVDEWIKTLKAAS